MYVQIVPQFVIGELMLASNINAPLWYLEDAMKQTEHGVQEHAGTSRTGGDVGHGNYPPLMTK
jgi:hypothetical protein